MTEGPPEVRSAEGRLGVLLPGMGAVATTTIAGVHLARKGLGQPIGSLTQMNTIRLGQRSDDRTPLIKDSPAFEDYSAENAIPIAGKENSKLGVIDHILQPELYGSTAADLRPGNSAEKRDYTLQT